MPKYDSYVYYERIPVAVRNISVPNPTSYDAQSWNDVQEVIVRDLRMPRGVDLPAFVWYKGHRCVAYYDYLNQSDWLDSITSDDRQEFYGIGRRMWYICYNPKSS